MESSLRKYLFVALIAIAATACGRSERIEAKRQAATSEYPDCAALGAPVVDHACFHAEFGPFGDTAQGYPLVASATTNFTATTPNVNTVHTYYGVNLPGGSAGAHEGTVKYRPARTGDWAIFVTPDVPTPAPPSGTAAPAVPAPPRPSVPIQVLNATGAVVPFDLQHDVAGCGRLPHVRVVRLTAGVTYRIVVGPSPVPAVGFVLEKLSDFETPYFADTDGDGFGDPSALQSTACQPPAGFVTDDTDCDDTRAVVRPGAPELCDGLDNDCDGQTDEGVALQTFYEDQDGDGFGNPAASTQACAPTGSFTVTQAGDCDDQSAARNPSAAEVCDGVDNDCDASVDETLALATCGVGACARTGTTCAATSCTPGAPGAEICNAVDDDCDGQIDESLPVASCGVGACARTGTTCAATSCTPGTPGAEICNGVDDDCDGETDESLALATCGVGACARTGTSCAAASCAPGTPGAETCNGIDDDCDGQADEGLAAATCGVGACARTGTSCDPASCTPGAPSAETCNGVDDDCDGQIDEGATIATCGVGACARTGTTCDPASCTPGAPSAEVCNGVDDDCDGETDESLVVATCGVGACARTGTNCAASSCTPGTPSAEVCNGVDDDCDGQVDEAGAGGQTFYADADGDGYGSAASSVTACAQPAGYVTSNTDCNDADPAVNPGAHDTCDGVDNDCSGQVDDVEDPLAELAEHACEHAELGPFVSITAGSGASAPNVNTPHTGYNIALPGSDAERGGTVRFRPTEAGEYALMTSPAVPLQVSKADGTPVEIEVRQTITSCAALARLSLVDLEEEEYRITFGPTSSAQVLLVIEHGEHDHGEGEAPGDEGTRFFRDSDGDGHGNPLVSTVACGAAPAGYVSNGDDCDDASGATKPGAAEICDGADNDCDGQVDEQLALATCGVGACARTGATCGAASCTPGAPTAETCNGIDDDCDGQVDNGATIATCGVGECRRTGTSCDPASCTPGAPSAEICNGKDDDCDGQTDESLAAATCGVGACARTGTSCDPASCTPGAPSAETCNGVDDDCDGQIDEGATIATCGVGACARTGTTCDPASCTPGAPSAEVCNGVDDDCDGETDESLVVATCGVGACARTGTNCAASSCTPGTPSAEVCNGVDDDCDGQVDEGTASSTFYRDGDGDGFGNAAESVTACTAPAGFVTDSTDCNDRSAAVHPGAAEICDGLDNDCSGAVDDIDDEIAKLSEHACEHAELGPFVSLTAGTGPSTPNVNAPHTAYTIALPGSDTSRGGEVRYRIAEAGEYALMISPAVPYTVIGPDGAAVDVEIEQNVNNCAALKRLKLYDLPAGEHRIVFGPTSEPQVLLVIEAAHHEHEEEPGTGEEEHVEAPRFFRDGDGDGHGDPLDSVAACAAPPGYVVSGDDCDDANPLVHPGAAEVCDGGDNDCNGSVDDGSGAPRLYYPDRDGDGFGASPGEISACAPPSGHVGNNADCNDGSASVKPGEVEVCDQVDNDCDGAIDSVGGQSVCNACGPLVLTASKTYNPSRWSDGRVTLSPAGIVAIPAEIRVTSGNTGNHDAFLRLRRGGHQWECRYRGGSSQAHPVGASEIDKGRRWLLVSCSAGLRAGSPVEADAITLQVNGSSRHGTTQGRLELTNRACARKLALLVVGALNLCGGDAALKSRIEGLGMEVVLRTAAEVTAADAVGKAVVIVSESVSSHLLGRKLAEVSNGVVMLEPYALDDMGMTGRVAERNYGARDGQKTVRMVGSHPLAAGRTGRRMVVTAPARFGWGVPSKSAVIAATLEDAKRSAVFGYDVGAAMVGSTAPGRRVGWFATKDVPTRLNADGWALFDAAVRWASGP